MSKTHMGAFAAAVSFLNSEARDAIQNLAQDGRQAWRALEAIDRLRELGAPIEDEAELVGQAREHLARASAAA